MSQAQAQQKAEQAKEKSQAFAVTVYKSAFEVIDASINVSYYLAGVAYGIFFGLLGTVQNKQVQEELKGSLNGAKQNLLDGAYDIKARVAASGQGAVDNVQPKLDDLLNKGQAKAGQAQGKAYDIKNQAVSQGKQVQGQAKQTAQANGIKA